MKWRVMVELAGAEGTVVLQEVSRRVHDGRMLGQGSLRMVKDVGLTRTAGIVCFGDGGLTTTSALASTVLGWISGRLRPITPVISISPKIQNP
jgi:hypothetical protein